MDEISITTTRLVIKPLTVENAADMLEYRINDSICEYQSFHPKKIDDIISFITTNTVEFNCENSWFQVGVFLDSKLIGDIGIHFIGPENRQCEIGYTISHHYQKMGYGKESVKGIISYLFHTLGKHRIIASLNPENIASIALLESIGFRKEGLFKKSILINGTWEDDLIYALLNEEWK